MSHTPLARMTRLTMVVIVGLSLFASTLASSPVAAQELESSGSSAESVPSAEAGDLVFDPQLIVAPEAAVWPGGLTSLNGAVFNPGSSELEGPVQLSFSGIPDGFVFDAIEVAADTDDLYQWRCDEAQSPVTCTLLDGDGVQTSLIGESLATWRLTLAVDPDVSAAALPPVTVSATSVSNISIAPVQIALSPPEPGSAPIELRATSPYESDHERPIDTTFSVTNVSASAFEADSLTIVGAVPPGALTWEASGAGWSCADEGDSDVDPICRWTGGALERGERTTTLTIQTTHAELTSTEQDAGRALAWDVEARVSGEEAMSTSRPLETTLSVGATPSGTIVAEALDALVVVAPVTFAVQVDVLGSWLDHATGPISIDVTLPDGISLDDVDTEDWTCDDDAGVIGCEFVGTVEAGSGEEEGATDLVFTMNLTLAEETEVGAHDLAFTLDVPGEAVADIEDNRTTVSIVVSKKPEPVLTPTVHQDGEIVRDGAPLRLEAGSSFALGAENLGSGEADAGETVTLRFLAAPGLDVRQSSGDWTCEADAIEAVPFFLGTWHTCEHALATSLAPDAVLEPVTVDVIDIDRAMGAVSIPVEVRHDHAAAVDRIVRGLVGAAAQVAGPVVEATPARAAFSQGGLDEDGFGPELPYPDTFAVPVVVAPTADGGFEGALCGPDCVGVYPLTQVPQGDRILAGSEVEAKFLWAPVGMTAPDVGPPSLAFERWEICNASGCVTETSRTITPPAGTTSVEVVYYARGLDLDPPSLAAAGFVVVGRVRTSWDVDTLAITTEPTTSAAVEGETVTFSAGTYEPASTTQDLQWERCADAAGLSCAEIAGATGSTYTAAGADVGKYLRVVHSVVSPYGTLSSATTPTLVAGVVPANVSAPSLTRNEPSPGVNRWTADPGTWSNLSESSFAFEFQACDGADCSIVQTSSTSNTYEPTITELLAYGTDLPDVRVVVRAINRAGTASETVGADAFSSATPLVALEPVVITSSSTELVGATTPTVGTTARGIAPTWSWASETSVRWERCGSGSLESPSNCVTIPLESTTDLDLTIDEVDAYVRPVFTATNPWRGAVEHVGSAVGPVGTTTPQLTTPVSIAAVDLVPGTILQATPGTWIGNAADPLQGSAAWQYQWQRCANALSSSCNDVGGATGRSFTIDTDDVGDRFRVVETVQTVAGVSASQASAVTGAVEDNTPDPDPDQDTGSDPDVSEGTNVCGLIDSLSASGSVALTSRLTVDLGNWQASQSNCGASTTIQFSNAGFVLDGAVSLRNASGTVSNSVIRFTSGSVSIGGDGFSGLTFSLGTGGLTVDLTAGSTSIDGDVVADGLVGLGLPAGWKGATRVRFSASRGSQNIDIFGVAHAPTSVNVPTVGGVPLPSGLPVARIVGSLNSTGDLQLDAEVNGLVEFGSAEIDLVGSVARNGTSGAVSVEVAGTLAGAVELTPGLSLTSAELRWVDGVISGSTTMTLGSAVVAGSVSYRSSNNWTVDVSVEGNGEPITVAPQITLPSPSLSGTITRTSLGFEANVVVSIDRWAVGNGSSLVFEDASFTINHTCAGSARCQTTLEMAAAVSVDLGAGEIQARLEGSIDPSSGDFLISAAIDDIPTPPGLDVDGVRLVAEKTGGELSTEVRSEITVLGTKVEGSLSFESGQTIFSAELNRWTPIPDGPQFSDVRLTYSSANFTVIHDDEPVSFDGRTLAVSATVAAPTWLSDLVGDDLETSAIGSVDLTDGSLSLSSPLDVLSGQELLDLGGVSLTLGDVRLETSATPTSVTQRLAGDVELILPNVVGGSDIELAMTISAEGRGGVGGGFAASVSLPDGRGWSDAFGISGLDIDRLALSVEVTPAGATVGMAGEATLPSSMTEPLGIRGGTPILLAASIGVGAQCFAFSIGDGEQTAIDVAGLGLITASEASFVLAPSGCTIGNFVFEPGISFAFDGVVFGIDVEVSVAFDPARAAMSADLVLGDIDLVGLKIQDVELHVDMSPTLRSIEFGGKLDLFGATAVVEGSFESSPGGADIELSAIFRNVTVGGFGINELDVTIVTSDAMTSVAVSAAGDLSLLGTDVLVTLDVEFEQGVLQRAAGTGQLVTDLGPLSLDLTVGFDIVPGQFPTIDFVGSLEMAGLEMADVEGQINRRGATLHADLVVPGFLEARVGGWIAFPHGDDHPSRDGILLVVGGVPEEAQPGDFRLYAEDVTIGVAGFGLQADIEAELLDGNPRIAVDAELQLGTSSEIEGLVTLSGTIDGEKGVDLEGSGSVAVAEHELVNGNFAAFVRPDGAAGVMLQASIDLGGGEAVIEGAFERGSGYGTLFRLYGKASVSAGSFDFADVELLAVRDVPPPGTSLKVTVPSVNRNDALVHPECVEASCAIRFGFIGSATLEAPAIGEVDVDLGFSKESVVFAARVQLSGPLGDALGRPTVKITFDSNIGGGVSELTFRVSVGSRWGVPLRFVVHGSLRSDGRGSLDAQARIGGHWEINIPFGISEVKFWTRPSFAVGFDFDLQDPSDFEIRASIDAELAILVQWVSFVPSCCRSGWNHVLTIRAEGSTKPRYLYVSVDIGGIGTVGRTFR